MRISNTMLATAFLGFIDLHLNSAEAAAFWGQHSHDEIDVEQRRRAGSLRWLKRRLGLSG
jgi:hypothetical protein